MNERIKELAEQAGATTTQRSGWIDYGTLDLDVEKLAELIIKECAALCDQAAQENARTFYAMNQTQELGPALVAKGSQVQAEKLSRHIQQHFGEE